MADKDIKVTQAREPGDATEPAGPAEPADTAEPADAAETPDAAEPSEPVAAPEKAESAPATAESAPTAAESPPDPGGRGARRAAVVLGAVTVVLGAFGVWATVAASGARADSSAQNVALTNRTATAAVNREITAAVNTIFSYNYANTAATRQAAQGLLTGAAIRQYNTLFALVTKNAPAQKLVVTTRVTNSGVEMLSGNRARLLVFANQQDTRAGTGQTSYAGAMFAVTALHQGGRWKIENIDTFSG